MAREWTVTSRNEAGHKNPYAGRHDSADEAISDGNTHTARSGNRDIKVTAPDGSSYTRGK